MRITLALLVGLLPLAAAIGGPAQAPAPRPVDARFGPYSPDPDHAWNRLHQALFVREAADGSRHAHTTDPLLYRGSSTFLTGERHRDAVARLDTFLAGRADQPAEDPLKRLLLQRDLWAAFDYVAWYPDDWVHHSKDEPAAVALRTRLAKAINRLALDPRELAALPDNYALAVKAKQYPTAHDPERPERPFLPPDLFDPTGPWVRFHETTAKPMAEQHFAGSGGRAAHVIFLRLPGGRAATERYLKGLNRDAVTQFPTGTMVAMVRRALAVDAAAKVRVTPVTELVQIRVYRKIPAPTEPLQHHRAAAGEQDVYEFVLERPKLFAGQSGLRSVGPEEPEEPFVRDDSDPFERKSPPPVDPDTGAKPPVVTRQLRSCIGCHQGPGIHSVNSMQRGLKTSGGETFRTYAFDVEMKYTVSAKVARYDWGLLQGKLETK